MRFKRIAFLLAAIGAGIFISARLSRAAEVGFTIYFPDAKLMLKAETVNRVTYLPLIDILQFMNLPFTDAIALETLTIRASGARLVVTRNSGLISINDQIVLLRNPILREEGRWLAPVDFLTQGLSRATSTDFKHRAGTFRMFANDVAAPELVMNAQALGPITRLTLRSSSPLNTELQRDDQNRRAVLELGATPLDPLRERLDHSDRLVRSITFDDSDGRPKMVLDLAGDSIDIKVTPADENRIIFVDLARATETTSVRPPATVDAAAPKADVVPAQKKMKVVVIDPGHGGIESGATNGPVAEKDLSLALARKLRTTLQARLGAIVILTRDSDVSMDSEARSAVANNNQADLFITLHVGQSTNPVSSGSSIFVMKQDFGGGLEPTASRDRLFLPWYLAYRTNRRASGEFARVLQQELGKTIPGWKFPVRSAPLAVLGSVIMPAIALEIGNLNNTVNSQTLADPSFQNRLMTTIADAIQRYSAAREAAN